MWTNVKHLVTQDQGIISKQKQWNSAFTGGKNNLKFRMIMEQVFFSPLMLFENKVVQI